MRNLSLAKLKWTLQYFTIYEERTEDVVKLLKYAWDNENTKDRGNGTIDALRSLLALYAACIAEDLDKHEGFQLFLEDNGPFGRDFFEQLKRRLA